MSRGRQRSLRLQTWRGRVEEVWCERRVEDGGTTRETASSGKSTQASTSINENQQTTSEGAHQLNSAHTEHGWTGDWSADAATLLGGWFETHAQFHLTFPCRSNHMTFHDENAWTDRTELFDTPRYFWILILLERRRR